MRAFFDPQSYVESQPSFAACWGCERLWPLCPISAELFNEFHEVTGRDWPRDPWAWVWAHRDFRLLGLDPRHVPARFLLCLECTTAYMKSYQRLNAQQEATLPEAVLKERREAVCRGCPYCGVPQGELHAQVCTEEQCPYCGGRMFYCLRSRCPNEDALWPAPDDDRIPCTGEMPGVQACREFGWYVRPIAGSDFRVRCAADTDDAEPDFERLYREAIWDRDAKRFTKKTSK